MIFKSRYVDMLEQEVERLRAENAALVNSLLTRAGIAPVMRASQASAEPSDSVAAVLPHTRKRSWLQTIRSKEARDRKKFHEELRLKNPAPEQIEERRRLLEEQERKIDERVVEARDVG